MHLKWQTNIIIGKFQLSNDMCQNFYPFWRSVHEIKRFKWRYLCDFQNNEKKKKNFVYWLIIAFWWEKSQLKQNSGSIKVTRTLLQVIQPLRAGMRNLKGSVQTPKTLNDPVVQMRLLLRKTSTKWFWKTANWSCTKLLTL